MRGLFLEGGPLRVIRNGTKSNDYQLLAADHSWADDYSVIFVDQPVNTGFSYGNTTLNDMKEGSKEFINFINQFFTLFSEF